MIEDTLSERQKTHGDFYENAVISQGIKKLLRSGRYYKELNAAQLEALDVIATKLSRAVTGQPNPDDYHDIAGYATLAERYTR